MFLSRALSVSLRDQIIFSPFKSVEHIAGIESLQIHSKKSFQSNPLHKNSTDVTLIGGDDRALKEVLKVLKARRAFNFKAKDI